MDISRYTVELDISGWVYSRVGYIRVGYTVELDISEKFIKKDWIYQGRVNSRVVYIRVGYTVGLDISG